MGKMQSFIDQPYTNRHKIEALSLHDPLVYASLRMSDHAGHDWQTTLELLVLQLAAEKERLEEKCLNYEATNARPPAFLLPGPPEEER